MASIIKLKASTVAFDVLNVDRQLVTILSAPSTVYWPLIYSQQSIIHTFSKSFVPALCFSKIQFGPVIVFVDLGSASCGTAFIFFLSKSSSTVHRLVFCGFLQTSTLFLSSTAVVTLGRSIPQFFLPNIPNCYRVVPNIFATALISFPSYLSFKRLCFFVHRQISSHNV